MTTTAASINIQPASHPHLAAVNAGRCFIVCQNNRGAGKQLAERQHSAICLAAAELA